MRAVKPRPEALPGWRPAVLRAVPACVIGGRERHEQLVTYVSGPERGKDVTSVARITSMRERARR